MTIVLDTPEQINMWVLLSRRSQLKMHLAGFKVTNIVKACRRDVPGCEDARTALDCVVPVNYAISEGGSEIDYSMVNVHVLVDNEDGTYVDNGIYSDMSGVEADPGFTALYAVGRLELILTLEEPREATNILVALS